MKREWINGGLVGVGLVGFGTLLGEFWGGFGAALMGLVGLLCGAIMQGPCGNHHQRCPQNE